MGGVVTEVEMMAGRRLGGVEAGKEQMFHFDPVEFEVSVRNPRGLARRQSRRVVALELRRGLSWTIQAVILGETPTGYRRDPSGQRRTRRWRNRWKREQRGFQPWSKCCPGLRSDGAEGSCTPRWGSEPKISFLSSIVLPGP